MGLRKNVILRSQRRGRLEGRTVPISQPTPAFSADGRIQLRDLTVRYGRRVALEAVSGEFAAGSLTAIVGANGAGKSTLLAAIAGVVRPAHGAVICPALRRLAYLPQLATLDRDFPL